jgi:hypothetical protein
VVMKRNALWGDMSVEKLWSASLMWEVGTLEGCILFLLSSEVLKIMAFTQASSKW